MRIMNIPELYSEIIKLLPVKRNSDDFRKDLSDVLSRYLKLVKSIDDSVLKDSLKGSITRIEKLNDGIKDCVKSYYEGLHSTAFTQLKNQMNGYRETGGVINAIELCTIKKDDFFYRGRFFENNRHKSLADMFHIPLDKRGIVKTQRYSTPGYPCLYLGSSIYGCWEEMQQPKFDDLMISGFKTMRDINVLDLRTPSIDDFKDEQLANVLLRLPLIIACSIIVANPQDDFKPEYIIPQLLIEVIISNNRNERKNKDISKIILGVLFTSTHINNTFKFSDRIFDNLAIPVLDTSSSKGHCNILAECFSLTIPTCYEYEEIREEFGIDGGGADNENPEARYRMSKMGKLEKRIRGFDFHQFPYLVIPDEITIPADGSQTFIPIRTNTKWSIKAGSEPTEQA